MSFEYKEHEDRSHPPRRVEEVDKSVYLASLTPQDRENIMSVEKAFLEYMERHGFKGILIAVGRSVTKESRGTQRPDIDLVVMKEETFSFEETHELAKEIARQPGFKIGKIRKPVPHFGWPDLVLQDIGLIEIVPLKGTPLELMGDPDISDWKTHLTRQKEKITKLPQDFCILGQRK